MYKSKNHLKYSLKVYFIFITKNRREKLCQRTKKLMQHLTLKMMVKCPFCGRELEVYIWSFAGSGKRCSCGALLGMYGCVKEVENE